MAKPNKSFLIGALVGGIVGSVSALLFAPKAGKELRKDIAVGAQQVGESTKKIAGTVGETTTRIAKQVGSGATQLASKAKGKASDVIGSVRSWRVGRSESDENESEELNESSLQGGSVQVSGLTSSESTDEDRA